MTVDPEIAALIGPYEFDPEALREKYRFERDRRVRADGIGQYPAPTAAFAKFDEDPYVAAGFARGPLFDEVDIAIIGGGFGGMLMAARLKQQGFDDIRLIERGGDVGGTWYWNRYPGAMCDVESYVYMPLLEELGYVPKHRYALAPEIFQHSRNIASHFGLYDKACFQTSVTRLVWDDTVSNWIISTDRGDRMRARVVAMANGPLSRPKLPGIPGIETFSGHIFHTSRWDYSYTGGDSSGNLTGLANKRVGIVGTGATGIQCVPKLGESAQHLYVFQRTPASVDVRANRETPPEFAASLRPGWQQQRMDNFNVLMAGGDQEVDLVMDGWTDIYRKVTGTGAREAAKSLGRPLTSEERGNLIELLDMQKMETVRARVDALVADPGTAEGLKPWYRQLCKRPCFHDEYLSTFNRPNVTLVETDGTGVERINGSGVIVEGRQYELDCLIFATGFEIGTNYTRKAGYDIVGRNGETISEKWANGLRTLHGLQSNGFPNCFFLGLTQTGVTVNIPHTLNEQAKHAAHILGETRRRGASIVEATPEGEQKWVDEMHSKAHLGMKFYAECTPGYYNNEGGGTNPNGYFAAAYGGGPLRFFEILEEWRASGQMSGVELT
jgi:cation diffusion facilitator CzcD-associated flavoprotein CzcO